MEAAKALKAVLGIAFVFEVFVAKKIVLILEKVVGGELGNR